MHSHSSLSDGKVLIRLDTSVLEGRLNALADEWETNLKSIRAKVGVCAVDLQSVAADVNAIQRFLLTYHNRNMVTALSAHFPETSGDAAEAPTQGFLDNFAAAEGGSTENLLGMVAVARRLLADNEALRTSLDSATAALSTHSTTNVFLQEQLQQLQHQTTQQSAQVRSITSFLRLLGLTLDDDSAETSRDSTPLHVSASTESTADRNLTESALSASPLLLSFRQILLRDLTERLTSVVDQQSKDFLDAVAHLEDRLQRSRRSPCSLIGRQPAGNNAELEETVRSLNKRLKDMEERAVKREEFISLMRAKADSLLLPVKADNAALSDLETRLVKRCAELEERCAFADVERAEFRALLRSLVVAQRHPALAVTSPNDKEASQADVKAQSAAPMRGVLLGELLPTLRKGPSVGSSLPASRHNAVVPYPCAASTPQQLYRVAGTSHGSGVHGVPLSSAEKKEHAKALANLEEMRWGSQQASAAPSQNDDVNVVAIGMTAAQGAYAAFVSEQLTRRQIASLPALPYEKAPSLQ